MNVKNIVRSLLPAGLLQWNRTRKKKANRKSLETLKAAGQTWNKESLHASILNAGIDPHKDLMVHSALSAIGYVEGGPQGVVRALIASLDTNATLLMPTSPVDSLQAEHELALYDPENTPSKMGAVTEYFRSNVATHRSAHPLEPVSAMGPKAKYYTSAHHTDGTSYGLNSPWYKHMEQGGQILYIGTTLINSGTSLHVIEDAIGAAIFKFPIYLENSKLFKIKLSGSRTVDCLTKVHNPTMSKRRLCDGLIPILERSGALRRVVIGDAPSLLVDAAKMKSILLEEYSRNGVTMYTPEGS